MPNLYFKLLEETISIHEFIDLSAIYKRVANAEIKLRSTLYYFYQRASLSCALHALAQNVHEQRRRIEWRELALLQRRCIARIPGCRERAWAVRLSSRVQLKPDILFPRRIIRGAVRHVRNSRVQTRRFLSRWEYNRPNWSDSVYRITEAYTFFRKSRKIIRLNCRIRCIISRSVKDATTYIFILSYIFRAFLRSYVKLGGWIFHKFNCYKI